MASYTIPRTANVGDIWTAAWYNAEVRDDLKWLHDLEISSGSSFPASPISGQRHTLVVGNSRVPFTYDGSKWVSDVTRAQMHITSGGIYTSSPGDADLWAISISNGLYDLPLIDTQDLGHTAALTLQGRIVANVLLNLSGTLRLGIALRTLMSGASPGSLTPFSSTRTPSQSAAGLTIGPWADLVTGVDAVLPTLYSEVTSFATWQVINAALYFRFRS